jgi:hypothetical protein
MGGRTFVRALLGVLLAAIVGACARSGGRDSYRPVTLREACYGHVASKGFKYRFVDPEIVALNRSLGLIREGNELEFIAARDLEERLGDLVRGPVELAVVKRYSPYVHFRVEHIVARGDTVFPAPAGIIALPRITTAEEYGVSSFSKMSVDAIPFDNTDVLRGLVGKKIAVRGNVVSEERNGQTVCYLEGKNGRLRLAAVSDGVGLIVKLVGEQNHVLEAGLTMTEVEAFSARRQTRTTGTFEVNYVMYGNRLITS